MRTLQEMIERVKIHVRGRENLTWKPVDYENMLEEAARRMWRALLETPAKVYLRHSEEIELGETMIVSCQEDCLRIEDVKFLNSNGIYVPLTYLFDDFHGENLPPPMFRVGMGIMGWTDDQAAGNIRIIGLQKGRTIRLDYFREPVFPFADNGTFNAPDGEETNTYRLPELCDSACEHLAAALLCGEETSDGVPINYHGNQYASLLQNIARGVVAKPSRSYVRRVSGRRF